MNKLNSAIDRFCYNHPNFGISNLMLFILGGNLIVYVMDMLSHYTFSSVLSFIPAAILQGQVWRLLSFIIVPESSGNMIFFAITLYFYYFIGTQLEQQWGTARFNIFYFSGAFLSAVLGMIIGFVYGGVNCTFATTSMYYVNMSLFFAFATLYPDMRVLLFFVIPVKIKWLAWADAAMFALEVLRCLFMGQFFSALIPVIALLNYFAFFGVDILGKAQRTRSRVKHRTSAQTVNFKRAVKDTRQQRGYLHKCCVCGRTDTDFPNLEFRYCSRCAGYRCYCADHINNHVHVTDE